MRLRQRARDDGVPVEIAGGPCVEVWASPEELEVGGETARLGAWFAWSRAKHEWAQSQPAYSEALRRVGFRPPYRGA